MSAPALCINCNSRPRYGTHMFCGKGCAGQYAANQAGGPPASGYPPSQALVPAQQGNYGQYQPSPYTQQQGQQYQQYPQHQQQYHQQGQYQQQQGQYQQGQYQQQGQGQGQQGQGGPGGPGGPGGSTLVIIAARLPAQSPRCKLPGCTNPPFQPGADFCSKGHRTQGLQMGIGTQSGGGGGGGGYQQNAYGQQQGYQQSPYHQQQQQYAPTPAPPPAPLDPTKACIVCKANPKRGLDHFCSQNCVDTALKNAPCLINIPNNHDSFKSVANQFTQKWKTGTPPQVRFIFKIMATKSTTADYEKYKAKLEAKNGHTKRGEEPGNERRRWHGTTRACNLGDSPTNTKFCSNSGCALCNIIKTTYRMSAAAGGLFGSGIYTSATSSKSDTYSRNTCPSPYKSMMLNKVAVGKGYKLTAFQPSIKGPPPGYDSVIGDLVNDELIVYNNDGVRPSYLLIYG